MRIFFRWRNGFCFFFLFFLVLFFVVFFFFEFLNVKFSEVDSPGFLDGHFECFSIDRPSFFG